MSNTALSGNVTRLTTELHPQILNQSCHNAAEDDVEIFTVDCTVGSLSLKKDTIFAKKDDLFKGGVLGTGAQRSVIGMKQALAYCRHYKFELPSVNRRAKFRFADTLLPSQNMLHVFFPTPGGLKRIKVDVSDVNIPLLIGRDVLDEYGWNVLTVQNQLESATEGWLMGLLRSAGHIFAPWDEFFEEFYSREQLQKLHLHFMHPSSDKLFNLLRRATPKDVNDETKAILKDIYDACHACQTFSKKPITFQVRFPDEVVFNKEIRVDIMYLNGIPVLCIVDVGTNFIAARFLPRVDTETIWKTFLYAWALIYSSFPRKMLADQGSVFCIEGMEAQLRTCEYSVTAHRYRVAQFTRFRGDLSRNDTSHIQQSFPNRSE